jgi:sulfur-carrier protein
MIDVTLKIFGPLRDIVGRSELSFRVPPPYTGESAFEALASTYAGLRQWRSSVRLAVNLEYTNFDHMLRPGDEISFIPPVSGG